MSWECKRCSCINTDELINCPNCIQLTLEKLDEVEKNINIIMADRDNYKNKYNSIYNEAFKLTCSTDECAEIPGHKCEICRFLEKVRHIRES